MRQSICILLNSSSNEKSLCDIKTSLLKTVIEYLQNCPVSVVPVFSFLSLKGDKTFKISKPNFYSDQVESNQLFT